MFGTVPATTAIRATEDRRIAVVASELLGRPGTGGAGTADSLLAVALARHGYPVDLIVASGREIGELNAEWSRIYESAGVRITVLEQSSGVEPIFLAPAFEVFDALRALQPDVAIVNDWRGLGWAALRAREGRLELANTAFIVLCHGPGRVLVEFAQKVPDTLDRFGEDVAERGAIELADAVVSPSAWLIDWMRKHRWPVPESARVIQHIPRSVALDEVPIQAPGGPVRRLAFFGQLREGKGIRIFLDALGHLDPIDVVFLGAPSKRWPPETILSRAPGARIEPRLTREAALEELRTPGTLAVMPSLLDNSPCTVVECIEHGIPFVATDTGGIAELIAEEDRGRVLCPPTAGDLAIALQNALTAEPFLPARPSNPVGESLQQWLELIENVSPRQRRAERRPLRVAVVADGEQSLERARRLADRTTSVEVELTARESRREGLAGTTAEWVVFMDSDDEPDDAFIDTLVQVQAATRADVVTAAVRPRDNPDGVHLFLGNPAAFGLVENQYGVIGLVRASLASPELGDEGDVDPDWALFAKLALGGARVVSIPIPLATHAGRVGSVADVPGPGLRVLEAFEAAQNGQMMRLHDLPQLTATLAAALQRSVKAVSTATLAQRREGLLRRAARRVIR
jgi:O-antigen biosynthesis protein